MKLTIAILFLCVSTSVAAVPSPLPSRIAIMRADHQQFLDEIKADRAFMKAWRSAHGVNPRPHGSPSPSPSPSHS